MDADTVRSRLSGGVARSLLREIGDRLGDHARTGEPHAIDLRSLPMTDADRTELEAFLGQGEIQATMDIAGRSEVRETRFAGVWWVRHYGADDHIAAERIEIAPVPEILIADATDIAVALDRLEAELLDESALTSKEDAAHV